MKKKRIAKLNYRTRAPQSYHKLGVQFPWKLLLFQNLKNEIRRVAISVNINQKEI